MLPRLLLAFGLASALMPIGMAILTPTISGYESITTAQVEDCDPIHDPQGCPKVYI